MLTRMLLLAVLLLPATAQAHASLPEILSRSFMVEILWVKPPIADSTYTIGLTDGSEITVPRDRFRYFPEKNPNPLASAHARALVTAMVATAVPTEIDRIRRDWKTFQNFQYGRYRPKPGADRIRSDFLVAVFIQGTIHQLDLEATWNPYHDKD